MRPKMESTEMCLGPGSTLRSSIKAKLMVENETQQCITKFGGRQRPIFYVMKRLFFKMTAINFVTWSFSFLIFSFFSLHLYLLISVSLICSLSSSLSSSVSSSVVLLVVSVWCGTLKNPPPCVHSKRPPPHVHRQQVHMYETCGRFANTHGDVLNVHTGVGFIKENTRRFITCP